MPEFDTANGPELASSPDQTNVADTMARMDAFMRERRPVLYGVMDPQAPLGQHVESFLQPRSHETLQPREDFIAAMTANTRRLLGDEMAEKMRIRLERHPVVYTPHHMSIDYWSLTFQSVIAMAMAEDESGIIPVLAGQGVHGDNDTWLLGPMLERTQFSKQAGKETPVRFNVIPRVERHGGGKDIEYDHVVAAQLPAFNRDDVMRALNSQTLKGMQANKVISYKEWRALETLRDNVYLDPQVLAQRNYSDQATVANALLWKLVHAPELRDRVPDFAMNGFETISTELLTGQQGDLHKTNSLVHRVLFDRELRGRVLEELNGVPGCWHLRDGNDSQERGTMFFWGIDERDKGLVSLRLVEENGQTVLRGELAKNGATRVRDIPFTPDALDQALTQGTILPSLVTSFMSIALARGIVCYGGPMQVDYLTHMRNGLVTSMEQTRYDNWAQVLQNVPTANFVCSPTPVVTRYLVDTSKNRTQGPNDKLKPAGPIELLTQPLTEVDYANLRQVKMGDAVAVNWPTLYRILTTSDPVRDPELASLTERQIFDNLGGNEHFIVVQSANLQAGDTGQTAVHEARLARRTGSNPSSSEN